MSRERRRCRVELAQVLRRAREARGLTQREAADMAGLTLQTWGQVERGADRGKDETVASMAQVVGVTPDQLENVRRNGAADRLRRQLAELHDQAALTAGETRVDYDLRMFRSILSKLPPEEALWLVGKGAALLSGHGLANLDGEEHQGQPDRATVRRSAAG